MKPTRSKGWTPLLLMASVDDEIVGIAPLMVKRRLGIRYAKFLLKSPLSPDFISCDGYRRILLSKTLEFLFKSLHCQVVDLTLPAASPNTTVLRDECLVRKICSFQREDVGQAVLNVDRSWSEFAKSRGKKFLQDIRRTERNLSHVGPWRVLCLENMDEMSKALEQIMRVERLSWKQAWRIRTGQETDHDLLAIWAGSQYASRTGSSLKRSTWLLEVNEQIVAYAFILEYKEVASVVKSSYDRQYARFAPGIYLISTAIRRIFEKKDVIMIDFLTDVPFTKTWTSIRLKRARYIMTAGKGLSKMIMVIFGSTFGRHARRMMPNWLVRRASSILGLE
jgi:hypothetical protein